MITGDSDGITEDDKVESWRLHVLIEEGHYPTSLAEKLAAATHVDLHRAVALTRQGCSAELASEILL